MKAKFQVLFAVLLVVILPTSLLAQEDSEATGSVEIGLWDASTSGSPDVVSEYEANEGGPDLELEISSESEKGAVEVSFDFRDRDDYDLALDFDAAGRSIRSETAMTGLIHRLQHESLAHFAAATAHGRLTRHDDFAEELDDMGPVGQG